jgi:hypothetical protein
MKTMKTKKTLIPKIVSIGDLRRRASEGPLLEKYVQLAMITASNLGGSPKNLDDAINCLNSNAMETDEDSVVGEINFIRDLVVFY